MIEEISPSSPGVWAGGRQVSEIQDGAVTRLGKIIEIAFSSRRKKKLLDWVADETFR